MRSSWIEPEWQVDARIGALMTTRAGGVSAAPYDSLNLGRSAGDERAAVDENRRRFEAALGVPTRYLKQVHGAGVVRLTHDSPGPHTADAAPHSDPPAAAPAAADHQPAATTASRAPAPPRARRPPRPWPSCFASSYSTMEKARRFHTGLSNLTAS